MADSTEHGYPAGAEAGAEVLGASVRAALDAAYGLSTYVASIRWDGSRNSREWLEGLREGIIDTQAKIEALGVSTPKGTMPMSDAGVARLITKARGREELDAEGAKGCGDED